MQKGINKNVTETRTLFTFTHLFCAFFKKILTDLKSAENFAFFLLFFYFFIKTRTERLQKS
jgi:hypothetical protein